MLNSFDGTAIKFKGFGVGDLHGITKAHGE
jgi:hypothetical protein